MIYTDNKSIVKVHVARKQCEACFIQNLLFVHRGTVGRPNLHSCFWGTGGGYLCLFLFILLFLVAVIILFVPVYVLIYCCCGGVYVASVFAVILFTCCRWFLKINRYYAMSIYCCLLLREIRSETMLEILTTMVALRTVLFTFATILIC